MDLLINLSNIQRLVDSRMREVVGGIVEDSRMKTLSNSPPNTILTEDSEKIEITKLNGYPMFIDGVSRWGSPVERVARHLGDVT